MSKSVNQKQEQMKYNWNINTLQSTWTSLVVVLQQKPFLVFLTLSWRSHSHSLC